MQPLLTYRGSVAAPHCDHMGHMSVMWYVSKFDEASWNLLAAVGVTPSYMRQTNNGMVAVEHRIAYKRELLAGDILEVHSQVFEIRPKAIVFAHQMRNAETGEVAAECQFTGVHFDRTSRKAVPFSDAMRCAAERYMAESIELIPDAA